LRGAAGELEIGEQYGAAEIDDREAILRVAHEKAMELSGTMATSWAEG